MTVYLITQSYYSDNNYDCRLELRTEMDYERGYFTDLGEAEQEALQLNEFVLQKWSEYNKLREDQYKKLEQDYKKFLKRNEFLKANGQSPVPQSYCTKPPSPTSVSFQHYLEHSGAYHYSVECIEQHEKVS